MGSAERPWLPQASGAALPRPTPAPFSAPSPPVPRRQTASFSPGRQPALPEGAPGGRCPSEPPREPLPAAPRQRRRSRAGPCTRRSGAWMGCRGPLLRSSEVPPGVAERFILSGYRCPGSSAAQCLLSAFRPTNETGNFWTHFVALLVFAFCFLEPFRAPGGPLPPGPLEPFYYPLWSYCLGVCGLLAASSMAHLFNAMSLPVREICFYIDYGTISAYTVGASLAYFYYVSPPAAPEPANPSSGYPEGASQLCAVAGHAGTWFETLYVPASCLVALFCTLACCSTRRRCPRHRYLLRTLIFLLPFVVVSMPVFQKLWGQGGSPGTGHLFLRHCLWLLASGLFNVSKAPERFSPGKFDIWGHSHQWFHCCSFMSILDELHMIRGEMELLAEGPPLLSRAPTFLSTFGVMLLALALLATIVAWFGVRAHGSHYRDQSKAQKGD
ncbi:membrane progestin receptor epsilon-like [Pantherophis guttatus]|uniref:Membrane progestin receptor epsilon-like n=1 Tax=Pantherophis guttatus TaxID=94885 RepID=A0A6P9CU65_PANGU|nr:membrane progestin receptor epsilon-like [Pantherophis guttatus]